MENSITDDRAVVFNQLRLAVLSESDRLAQDVEALGAEDWKRSTRCPGWKVGDLAWHVAWGDGPGEVIRAAKDGGEPPAYATDRMGPPPTPDEIVQSMRERRDKTHADLDALTAADADLVVRYGRNDPGRSIADWFWHSLCELVVHGDDLRCAVGKDEKVEPWLANGLVHRRVTQAIAYATKDGLQPVAPRCYRVTNEELDCGFFWNDGSWHEGIADGVPTCTFTADPTTLLRLVMGRIPAHPLDAGVWDERLGLSGDVRVASPNDFKRWCYGVW